MTSSGKRIAAMIGIAIAFLLPRHVECGYPGGTCSHVNAAHRLCTSYEMEPLGFWVIELIASQDVGFAYATGEDCR